MSSDKIRRGPAWASMRVPGGANKFQLQLPSNSTLFQVPPTYTKSTKEVHVTLQYTRVHGGNVIPRRVFECISAGRKNALGTWYNMLHILCLCVLGNCGDALNVVETRDHLQGKCMFVKFVEILETFLRKEIFFLSKWNQNRISSLSK